MSAGRPSPPRIVLGAAGLALGLFGVFRLLTEVGGSDLFVLFLWLAGAVAIHDGVLSPIVVGIGAAIARVIPPRGRRYVQGALIAGALITIIALPMIHEEKSQPAIKAILRQNFAANLAILLTVVAAGAVLLYVLRVVRDARVPHPASAVNERPPDDQLSAGP